MRKRISGVFLIVVVLALFSCSKEESSTLKVNHYMSSCMGWMPRMCYLQQEDLSSDRWEFGYDDIIGFDYEWGYIYDLKVEIIPIENPPMDASSQEVRLLEVVSKVKAKENITFEIPLRDHEMDVFYSGSEQDGFTLLNGITIEFDNTDLIEAFMERVYSVGGITGIFKHKDHSTIQLVGFKE